MKPVNFVSLKSQCCSQEIKLIVSVPVKAKTRRPLLEFFFFLTSTFQNSTSDKIKIIFVLINNVLLHPISKTEFNPIFSLIGQSCERCSENKTTVNSVTLEPTSTSSFRSEVVQEIL